MTGVRNAFREQLLRWQWEYYITFNPSEGWRTPDGADEAFQLWLRQWLIAEAIAQGRIQKKIPGVDFDAALRSEPLLTGPGWKQLQNGKLDCTGARFVEFKDGRWHVHAVMTRPKRLRQFSWSPARGREVGIALNLGDVKIEEPRDQRAVINYITEQVELPGRHGAYFGNEWNTLRSGQA